MNNETSTESSHSNDPIVKKRIIRLTSNAIRRDLVNDAAHATRICRRFLTILGIWQPTDPGAFFWRSIKANIPVVICYYGIGIRLIPTTLYIIFDGGRPTEILLLMARCLFVLMGAIKIFFLRYRRQNIQKCIKQIELDWIELKCTASKNIMLERARIGNLITRICVTFTFSAAIFQLILPLIFGSHRAGNANYNNTSEMVSIRKFAVPSHFGHSVFSETPIYEFIYSSQVIATFMLHTIGVTSYSLTTIIVMHACGQLKILGEKLNEVVDGGGETMSHDTVDGRMTDVVKHHVRALRFISSIEKMLREICFVELGGYTIQLCVVGYLNLLEFRKEIKNPIAICAYMMLFITATFYVFLLCVLGEFLSHECSKIGEKAYMIEWHRLPGKQALDLCLIIIIAHSPVTLTAGGVIQLSFNCFANVAKTSMGYFNMLRAVID